MKLRVNTTEYNLYDTKPDALSESSDKSKETLIVKSDKNYFLASTEKQNSPTSSNFKITGNETRYLHTYTLKQVKKWYDPRIRNGSQADFEAHPSDYYDEKKQYSVGTPVYVNDYVTEYGWWCTNVIGFSGVLGVYPNAAPEYWSTDVNSVNNNATVWWVVHANGGVLVVDWRQVTRQTYVGNHYDHTDYKFYDYAFTTVKVPDIRN